jgi:surface antigen
MRIATLFLSAVLLASFAAEALADPPSWAPAHGYRDKGKGKGKHRDRDRDRGEYYVGYSGREYDRDYGIVRGRCNREEVGAVLGGVVGGVVGNRVADREDRTVATILGAAVGALLGAKIGRDMDDRDRACVGQALELGASGRRVAWTNESTGMRYELVPAGGARDGGPACREFTLVSLAGSERRESRGLACQERPGVWDLARR